MSFFRDAFAKLTASTPVTIDPAFRPYLEKWRAFFLELPAPYSPLDILRLDVRWNHRMRSRAGLCRPATGSIELNPHLLTFEHNLEEVLLHEICHMAVSFRFPYADAHGQKWKKLMVLCGQKPKRCHELIPQKRHLQKRWNHACDCQVHKVTTLISNRLKRGQKYKCKKCGSLLKKDLVAELAL